MANKRPASRWFVKGSRCRQGDPPPIDFQMHTTWTDGRSSVAEMIAAAESAGLAAMAITEHLNFQSTYYSDFVAEVVRLRESVQGLEIYYGVEVAVRDFHGSLKTDLDLQQHSELALGVVHAYPDGDGGFRRFGELSAEEALDLEIRALEGLAGNPRIDVLGHPGGTFFRKFGPFPVERMEPAFRRAKENGIAVEWNTSYCWDPRGFRELLNRVDPLVSFGSDAHEASMVGSNIPMIRSFAT